MARRVIQITSYYLDIPPRSPYLPLPTSLLSLLPPSYTHFHLRPSHTTQCLYLPYSLPSLLPPPSFSPLLLNNSLPSASLRHCSMFLPTSSSSSYWRSSWLISRWISCASRNLCCCLRRSWMATSLVSYVPISGRVTLFCPRFFHCVRLEPVRGGGGDSVRRKGWEVTQCERGGSV